MDVRLQPFSSSQSTRLPATSAHPTLTTNAPETSSYHWPDFRGSLHNHEASALNNRKWFKWIKEYYELKVQDPERPAGVQRIILFHYAMRVWRSDFRGTWHLYGHSHNNLPEKPDSLSFDIGVDANDFYPLSYAEVKARMLRKVWKPPLALREE